MLVGRGMDTFAKGLSALELPQESVQTWR
jgi:hypothetical protein